MDTRCEYEEISDQHPELILLSKSPPTWRGFLIISHLSYDECNIHCPRVKLNLVVPNYPLLCDARINFGRQITALRSRKFSQNVRKLMTSPLKVSSFLMQLQLLIVSIIIHQFILFFYKGNLYYILYIMITCE